MGFVFKQGDMSADWTPSIKSGQGVDLVVFHAWTAERATVDSINPAKNRVLFKKPLRKAVGSHPFSSGYRYVVENVESGEICLFFTCLNLILTTYFVVCRVGCPGRVLL